MKRYVRTVVFSLFSIGVMGASSCSRWSAPAEKSDALPDIFPDYIGVTVPSNIAPLNFMVEGADKVQARLSFEGREYVKTAGKDGVVKMDVDDWKDLLDAAEGSAVSVEVDVWDKEHPDGIGYRTFVINIAEDPVDEWLAYRLIEPGYKSWRQLGLYQRSLSSFEESAIVTNGTDNETCVNCHHFPSYSSESMMFHARGKNGGTILYHNGSLTKIEFNKIGPKKNTTYPAWHPDGRLIAFSSNTTKQTFYVHGQKPLEVYDHASDLVLYDTHTGEVLTDPRFMTEETLESFPAWSPDGNYLYFVAEEARPLPEKVEEMHYSLVRVPFDKASYAFGEQIDMLYNARISGGSASYPRISADGRYLLYTWSAYGTFPVWHQEADLRMIDLITGKDVDVEVWNDPVNADSYHSWSSDGRWAVFGSRRLDGRYTRLYLAYFDKDGKAHKPFLLPQEDPRYNVWRLKSYNVPEFINGKVELPEDVVGLFHSKN